MTKQKKRWAIGKDACERKTVKPFCNADVTWSERPPNVKPERYRSVWGALRRQTVTAWLLDCLTVSRATSATRNFLCDRCTPVITIICSLHILFWLMISVWQYSLCLNCSELENAAWCVITAICYGFLNTRWKAVVTSFFSPLSFLEEEKRFGLWDQREECVCVYMSACVRALSLSTSETVIRFSKKFDMGNIKLEANRYL